VSSDSLSSHLSKLKEEGSLSSHLSKREKEKISKEKKKNR
jgi:hypothetical protein